MELLVKDILKRPHFEDAEVLAGKKGLNRVIKWVHIVEINTFGHLLNGQEMVLTTGIGWINDTKKSLHYLQQLLDYHASVLCIEIDSKIHRLPKEMLTLADENNFPIILFHKEVKFIEITKDIHQLLLNYQESIWLDLEDLYKKMNQILVDNGTIADFLKSLHQGTNKQVVLHSYDQYWYFPSLPKNNQGRWLNTISKNDHTKLISHPIYFMSELIGHLYLIDENQNQSFTIYDQFALNRCGEFIAQYFWKFHQQSENQTIKKNEWLFEAVRGQLSKEAILDHIYRVYPDSQINEVIVSVIPSTSNVLPRKVNDNFLAGTLMSIRHIFEKEGFFLIASKDKNNSCYILLLLNQLNRKTLHERLKNAFSTFSHADPKILALESTKWLSFGKPVNAVDNISQSYQTALATLHYQKNIEQLTEPFYQNLGTFRLFHQFQDRDELQDIIDDYIGTIISYDREKGTELVKTLKVYLKNLGAKNQTADELFIVRQTLYHRIERIEALIGKDFMNPNKRMMIEFAIEALAYLGHADI